MTTEPLPDSRVIRPFGKYYLVQKLAEGGMAEIFLAKQVGVEGFEKNVVIKRMHQHLSSSPEFVAMFLDEARLAASLLHPNIVQIIELGQADGCYYICMEYLAGEDLAAVLRVARKRQEAIPLHVVLRVIAEAAQGLHFAHEHTDGTGKPLNIVHRDVGPANLFITYAGQVKVLDFGIAKAESTVTHTNAGVLKGKYQYMSPEQASGEKVDRRSDIYALGVTLYEALSLSRPFARETDLAILKAVLEGDCVPLTNFRPDLPPEVVSIVNRAMSLDRDQRFATAAELAKELELVVGTVTSSSGNSAVSLFMNGFVGDERLKSRSRIPSFPELAAQGVEIPPLVPGEGLRASPAPFSPDVATPAQTSTGPMKAAQPPPPSPSRAPFVIGAVLLAVAAWALGFNTRPSSSVTPPAPAAVVPPSEPTRTVEVKPALPTPTPTVAVTPPEPVMERRAPEPRPVIGAKAPPKVEPQPLEPKNATLTDDVIRAVFAGHTARLQGCFAKYRRELSAPKGRVMLTLAIAGTGRVTRADVDLRESELSRCLRGIAKEIRFPGHASAEASALLPLNYDVR